MVNIIAEIGISHAGRLDHALGLIRVAADAGCDSVKFQAFSPLRLAPLDYERQAMLKGLALTESEMLICAAETRRAGLEFIVTPMDTEWLAFCVMSLNVKRIKVGSAQVADEKFIAAVASVGRPVIISNGMTDNAVFCRAVGNLIDANCDVTPMSCISKYPTPDTAPQMQEIARLRDLFPGMSIGYSSHSPSIWPTIAAVYAGATVTENHIALPGVETPDYSSSLKPEQLTALVREIRYAEKVRV